MNETFQIPEKSSLYNIKAVYNQLVAQLGDGGLDNLLTNPEMNQIMRDSASVQSLGGWESNFGALAKPFGMSADDWFRQDLTRLSATETYTVVLDIKNPADITLEVLSSTSSSVVDFYDNTADPSKTIVPALDDLSQPIRQQVALTFTTGPYDPSDPPMLKVTAVTGQTLTPYNAVVIKGTFAFNASTEKSIFSEMVRYADDGTAGYYEVSADGTNYHRLFTSEPVNLSNVVDILSADIYTKEQMDTSFLRKDIADSASALITFLEGLKAGGDVNLESAAKLLLDGGEIVANAAQTSGVPTNFFSVTVKRGDQPDVGIRYNEAIDRWQFTHDGLDWKILGEGGAGGGGASSFDSELEYFAEILDRSGYRWGYYDLFNEFDLSDSVKHTNVAWNPDNTFYYVDGTTAGPWVITSRNVMPTDQTGEFSSFFVHALTNQADNTGLSIYYTLDGTGIEPPANDSTSWIATSQNELVNTVGNIDTIYFKFEFDSTAVEFHGFGMYYGVWEYRFSTETRLRQYDTIVGAHVAPYQTTVPNAGAYSFGQEALELYRDKARAIPGIDYNEIDENTVEWLIDFTGGEEIEYYEKYGYVDFSADNLLLINAHVADTTAHGDPLGALAAHIADATAHEGIFDNTGTTGYQLLPSGLIIQWGQYTGGAHAPTITLPLTYPNQVFSVVSNIIDSTSAEVGFVEIINMGTSSFEGHQQRHDSLDINDDFTWISIGY